MYKLSAFRKLSKTDNCFYLPTCILFVSRKLIDEKMCSTEVSTLGRPRGLIQCQYCTLGWVESEVTQCHKVL